MFPVVQSGFSIQEKMCSSKIKLNVKVIQIFFLSSRQIYFMIFNNLFLLFMLMFQFYLLEIRTHVVYMLFCMFTVVL